MSWPRSRSRSGCSATSRRSSATEVPSGSASSASTRSSVGVQPQLLQPRGAAAPAVRQVGERGPAPQVERLAQDAAAAARGRPAASAAARRAASRSKRWASTSSGSTASRYPPPWNSIARRSVRRSRETWACRALAASAGGSSPYRPSISRSTATTRPASSSSITSSARGRGPPTATPRRQSARTSSAPRIPNHTGSFSAARVLRRTPPRGQPPTWMPGRRAGSALVLADDLAHHRGRVALAEDQVAEQQAERVALGPLEVAARQHARRVAQGQQDRRDRVRGGRGARRAGCGGRRPRRRGPPARC